MRFMVFLSLLLMLAGGGTYFVFADAPPPQMQPIENRADLVLIDRSTQRLTLIRGEDIIADYPVEEPRAAPCPISGTYQIERRNPRRMYRLSLGLDPVEGRGEVVIHGSPRVPPLALSMLGDWQAGCIALSNDAMRAVYSQVSVGAEVVIR